jgi:hypothetical protein
MLVMGEILRRQEVSTGNMAVLCVPTAVYAEAASKD